MHVKSINQLCCSSWLIIWLSMNILCYLFDLVYIWHFRASILFLITSFDVTSSEVQSPPPPSCPPSSPHSFCVNVFLTFLWPLTFTSCCSSSPLRVSIDPAKRQTAKTGPAIPSTQGAKTLSKSSALQSLSAFPSFLLIILPWLFFFFFFFNIYFSSFIFWPQIMLFIYSFALSSFLSFFFPHMSIKIFAVSSEPPLFLSFRSKSRRYREL